LMAAELERGRSSEQLRRLGRTHHTVDVVNQPSSNEHERGQLVKHKQSYSDGQQSMSTTRLERRQGSSDQLRRLYRLHHATEDDGQPNATDSVRPLSTEYQRSSTDVHQLMSVKRSESGETGSNSFSEIGSNAFSDQHDVSGDQRQGNVIRYANPMSLLCKHVLQGNDEAASSSAGYDDDDDAVEALLREIDECLSDGRSTCSMTSTVEEITCERSRSSPKFGRQGELQFDWAVQPSSIADDSTSSRTATPSAMKLVDEIDDWMREVGN
jgi:hypothetical protein